MCTLRNENEIVIPCIEPSIKDLKTFNTDEESNIVDRFTQEFVFYCVYIYIYIYIHTQPIYLYIIYIFIYIVYEELPKDLVDLRT